MDYLMTLFNSVVDNEQHAYWLFLGFAFISTVALTASVWILVVNARNPLKKQLEFISHQTHGGSHGMPQSHRQLNKTLESLEKYVTPKSKTEQFNVKQMLMHAGFENHKAVASFYAIKIILALLLALGTLVVTRFLPEVTTQQTLIYTMMSIAIATFLPNFVLKRMANRRIKALRNAFPDALDLLVVASEAGLGFQAALNRVATEIGASSPALSHELQLVCQKIRVGASIPMALNQFVARSGLQELQGLISIINQSIKLGASMGDTLREYAEEFRDRRQQKAEEEAAKIGTKMIFPLVTCIWPGFFAVAVGPAVVKVLDMFAGR